MEKKIKKEKFGKKDIAEAIKYYLDNMGALITYKDPVSATGYRYPVEITKTMSRSIAKHVVNNMQKALVDDKQIYFVEIGSIDVITKKKGTNLFNPLVQSLELIKKNKKRIKITASDEMIKKLNHEK